MRRLQRSHQPTAVYHVLDRIYNTLRRLQRQFADKNMDSEDAHRELDEVKCHLFVFYG